MVDLSGSRVLVTGGLGFIGSNLAHRLVGQVARLTLVDSLIPEYGGNLRNVSGLEGRAHINISDVRDPHGMAHLVKSHDVLFNLAGQTSHVDSMVQPEVDLAINASAQLAILEACRRWNPAIRVVFASTRQIYGRPTHLPVDESHPISPVDINGVHKAAAEWYHRLYDDVHGVSTISLRFTNTYGPRMRVKDARQTFLGIWIRAAVDRGEITVYGDGRQLRDFLFVEDAVDALIASAVHDEVRGIALNIGGPAPVALSDVAALLMDLRPGTACRNVPFPAERAAIDIGDFHADSSLAERLLGWSPQWGLRPGLLRTLDYFEAHAGDYWSNA